MSDTKKPVAAKPPADPAPPAAPTPEAVEKVKAHRARHVLTGQHTGETADEAFAARIAAAKLALTGQSHGDIETLLDEMMAALQRIEAAHG